jgi:hypothetical protein
MFAASTADWVMFAGIAAALGGLAAAGYAWILREPPETGPAPEQPAASLPRAA